jgi:hypothetical protein
LRLLPVWGLEQEGKLGMEYEKPEVRDYGTLVELTAASAANDSEDGLGKVIHTDGSQGLVP